MSYNIDSELLISGMYGMIYSIYNENTRKGLIIKITYNDEYHYPEKIFVDWWNFVFNPQIPVKRHLRRNC